MELYAVTKFFPLILFSFTLSISNRFAVAQTETAVVSIITIEQGLPVFVDGIQIGITPIKNFALSAGQHEISLRHLQSESWLDKDWVEKYDLASGDTLDIRPIFERGYMINSKPYGADVIVDNSYQGTTPLVVYLREDEKKYVEVRLKGYEKFVATIDSTTERLWLVNLVEDRDHSTDPEIEISQMKSRRSRFRRLATIAGSLSAASGITAILLKRQADRFYQDYLSASNPENIEAYFNKTERYDEYAGSAFIVFQVSFGLSFYWFLRSTTAE